MRSEICGEAAPSTGQLAPELDEPKVSQGEKGPGWPKTNPRSLPGYFGAGTIDRQIALTGKFGYCGRSLYIGYMG